MRKTWAISLVAACSLLATGCSARKSAPEEWKFVFIRGGLMLETPGWTIESTQVSRETEALKANFIALKRDRAWVEFPWKEKERFQVAVRVQGLDEVVRWVVAPLRPSALSLSVVSLPRVSAGTIQSGSHPDACVAFSPDESRVACGTYAGRFYVIDVLTGKVEFTKRIPTGLVKQVAFSPDSKTLYVGEQSPDGNLYAYDLVRKRERFRIRLADELGEAKTAKVRDRLEVYSWPSASCIKVHKSGDVFVSGIHTWYEGETNYIQSRIYRIDGKTGKILSRFPADKPLSANLMWFDLTRDGRLLLTGAFGQKSVGPGGTLDRETVFLVDTSNGETRGAFRVPVLREFFDTVYFWKAFLLESAGERAYFATLDGRVYGLSADDEKLTERWRLDAATPVDIGGLPVYASAGWMEAAPGAVLFTVSGSAIPYGSPFHSQKLPAPHPEANTLWVVNEEGKVLWKWRFPAKCEEVHASKDGELILATVSQDYGETVRQPVGGYLFEFSLRRPKESRLLWSWETVGPVVTGALSGSGRYVALVEVPMLLGREGKVIGEHRLHILH